MISGPTRIDGADGLIEFRRVEGLGAGPYAAAGIDSRSITKRNLTSPVSMRS